MPAAFLVALYEYSPLFYISVVFVCFLITSGLVMGWSVARLRRAGGRGRFLGAGQSRPETDRTTSPSPPHAALHIRIPLPPSQELRAVHNSPAR